MLFLAKGASTCSHAVFSALLPSRCLNRIPASQADVAGSIPVSRSLEDEFTVATIGGKCRGTELNRRRRPFQVEIAGWNVFTGFNEIHDWLGFPRESGTVEYNPNIGCLVHLVGRSGQIVQNASATLSQRRSAMLKYPASDLWVMSTV